MIELNRFVNRYFGIILLISAIAGLYIPTAGLNISLVIILSLALVIFCSFFRVELRKDTFYKGIVPTSIFIIVRYLILPVIVFFILKGFTSFYAVIFFLLFLLPAAVSSPAFSSMFDGNVTLSLKILVFTSFLTIFSIPLMSRWILVQSIIINSRDMFLIMIYTIVIPFFVHLPFRKSVKITDTITTNSPLITAFGLIVIYIVSTSKNKEIILSNPEKILLFALISVVVFLFLYITGYYLNGTHDKHDKIAYSVSSGANNIGIGVTLTMLFFPGDINVFFIISQLTWIFVLIPMRYFYRRHL